MTTTLPATQQPHMLFPEFSEFFSAFPSFAGNPSDVRHPAHAVGRRDG